MEKGKKVMVDLNETDGKKLGIGGAVKGEGVIVGHYTNGIDGHYVSVNNKKHAIPAKCNAITPM